MDKSNKNNRSLLAMAGENSISSKSSKQSFKPSPVNHHKFNRQISAFHTGTHLQQSQQKLFDPKQIIKKLGLARLRKMQALVRGFLVRRKIYPKQLQDYLIAQSAMNLIIANVIYREVSGIVVQTISLSHYDINEGGQARMIEQYLYNSIVKRVIEKQFLPIAKQAIYQTAIYASRPQITYGFNLRQPLELAIFLRINSIIEQQSRQIAEICLRQEADQRRELKIINDLILNMPIIPQLCLQIVNQCLLEGTQEYVVQQIIDKITKEGAEVVAEITYNDVLAKIQDQQVNSLVQQAQQWLLQECIFNLIYPKIEMNTNQQNLPLKNEL